MQRTKLFRLLTGLTMMALSFWSISAVAQSLQSPGDLTGLMSATPQGDWSMKLWRYVFGDFADSPFSPGTPGTLLGNLFVIFNTAIFTVGFSWAMYGVTTGVVQTAHEGEVLGKRLSTVWFPIRMTVGIAGMVPVFKGFTLFQSLMMMMTAVGIGIGNSLWTAGVNSTSEMQALVNQDNFQPTAVSDVRKTVQSIFLSGVCLAGEQDAETHHNPPLASSQTVGVVPYALDGQQEGGYRFGSQDDPMKCGSVSVQANARSESSALAFRAGGVNYNAIATAAAQAYKNGMTTMVQSTVDLAKQWYAARKAANDNDTAPPQIPMDQLNAVVQNFISTSRSAITAQTVDAGALRDSVKSNMTALGWFGAGAWFSTFAEANAAIADAAKGPTMSATALGSGFSNIESTTMRAVEAAQAGMSQALAKERAVTGDTSRAILDSAIQDSCSMAGVNFSSTLGTATGNCSLGQSIVSAGIRASAIGSGGGGNSGTFSLDSTGLVNPIIMMKNIGDYVMSFSSTVLVAGAAMEAFAETSMVGKVASGADNLIGKVTGSKISDKLAGLWSVLKLAAIMFLVLGTFLSIYVPMIPFVTWMGAILAYAASVIEGMAGASLHAMAHLEGEGEGLGQRTGHGYLFMINVIARPALMVIGFFVASALMIIIGTLQAQLFLPAMANVQGNSITGIFSIGAFLIIFGVMNLTLISASFNLIYVITDQVIGFVGGHINSHLGRETEDKVHGVFMVAGRFAPNAMSQVGALREQMNKAKASGATGDAASKLARGGSSR